MQMKTYGFGEHGYRMATPEQGDTFKAVIGTVAMQGELVRNSWEANKGYYAFTTELTPRQLGQLHPETIDRLMVFSDEEPVLSEAVVQLTALAPETAGATYLPGMSFSHQCVLSRQIFDADRTLRAINTALFYASEPTALNPSGLHWDFAAAVLQRPINTNAHSQMPNITKGTSGYDEMLALEQQLIPSADETARLIKFAAHQSISS